MKIDFISNASLHPAGKGKIESQVKIVKYLMRKLLAYRDDYYWDHTPFIITKTLNSTISPRTGFTPNSLVYGPNSTDNWLSNEPLKHSENYFANIATQYKYKHDLLPKMQEVAKEKVFEIRTTQNTKKNEKRVTRQFHPNDIVYEIDKSYVPGAGRPLKTTYNPSPFVVKEQYYTTVLVSRIADGTNVVYGKDRIKKYTGEPNIFSNLPTEVRTKFLGDFEDLDSHDINAITKIDNFTPPDAIDLNKIPIPDEHLKIDQLPDSEELDEQFVHFDDEEVEQKSIQWPEDKDLEQIIFYDTNI